ncbi:MAG: hypothetical protein HY321_15750 [Armatimonadetes bacterium]|nr:hypothetical protein [Armatimonadota bacterium]
MRKCTFVFMTGLAVSLLAALAGRAVAGEKGEHRAPPPAKKGAAIHKPGGPGKPVFKELGLTEAQHARIRALEKDLGARMEAIMKDEALTKEQKRAKMKPLFEERQRRMDAILTAEQKAKLKALMKAKAEARMKEGHRPKVKPGLPAKPGH